MLEPQIENHNKPPEDNVALDVNHNKLPQQLADTAFGNADSVDLVNPTVLQHNQLLPEPGD